VDAAESVAARLIGSLFVERGLASESQIALALEIQDETGQQLGEILVERFGVSRGEIATVIAEQWQDIGRSSGPGLEASLSESWRRLGEIFVTRGFVTQDELERALSRQRQTGERLGEALVALGAITKFELAGALGGQTARLGASGPVANASNRGTVVALPSRPAEPEASPHVVSTPDSKDADLESVLTTESVLSDESTNESGESPAGAWRHLEALPPLPDEPAGETDVVETDVVETEQRLEPVPAVQCVAFAPTSSGYVLVPFDGAAPAVGAVAELDGLGQLHVLRHASSPLPHDPRPCLILERRAANVVSFSFAD